MQLAMYKGPATGRWNKMAHWAICVATLSRSSHCELVIGGVCFSSSFRDGGVRAKYISDLHTSGRWDIREIEGDERAARERFEADIGKPYDWWGMLRVCPLLRWLPRNDSKRFCSEEIAHMLGLDDPETYSPAAVLKLYQGSPA